MTMQNLLSSCYTFSIIVILFMVGCTDHKTRDHGADTVAEQWSIIPYEPLPSRSTSPIEAGVFEVVRIIDGDTIIVGDSADRENQHRIRLIGIDAPELARGSRPAEPYANEATDFVRQKIEESGNRVRLSFDGEQLDQYRRTRAMVWLKMPDGQEVWLNEMLIREGLALARLDFRYSHSAKMHFALAEWDARISKRNIWQDIEN